MNAFDIIQVMKKIYKVFVVQAGENAKDVYVGQSHEDVALLIQGWAKRTASTPKMLRNQILKLRDDLKPTVSEYSKQSDAIDATRDLAMHLMKNGYNIKSKNPHLYGGKKNRKQIKPYLSSVFIKDEPLRLDNKYAQSDVFKYGKKKPVKDID